jgi:hypothetical protein
MTDAFRRVIRANRCLADVGMASVQDAASEIVRLRKVAEGVTAERDRLAAENETLRNLISEVREITGGVTACQLHPDWVSWADRIEDVEL